MVGARAAWIYTGPKHLELLRAFMFAHLEHELEFCGDWWYERAGVDFEQWTDFEDVKTPSASLAEADAERKQWNSEAEPLPESGADRKVEVTHQGEVYTDEHGVMLGFTIDNYIKGRSPPAITIPGTPGGTFWLIINGGDVWEIDTTKAPLEILVEDLVGGQLPEWVRCVKRRGMYGSIPRSAFIAAHG